MVRGVARNRRASDGRTGRCSCHLGTWPFPTKPLCLALAVAWPRACTAGVYVNSLSTRPAISHFLARAYTTLAKMSPEPAEVVLAGVGALPPRLDFFMWFTALYVQSGASSQWCPDHSSLQISQPLQHSDRATRSMVSARRSARSSGGLHWLSVPRGAKISCGLVTLP